MATPNDIYNEITRIDNAKKGIAEAIEEKGVQVPDGTPIQDFPAKVRQIQTGSPDAVLYTPQELTPEQQGQARQNIGAGTYTKPGTGIPSSDLAEPVQTLLGKANTAVQPEALTPITDLIPEQATPQNQLADKNFVNSSVATNTANYISDNGQPFQSVADLEAYTGTLTNNDYAFVVGTDSAGNTTYTRYKYNATTQTWAAEYVLNNSSFTAEQWAAISSGITALLVQKLTDLPTEVVTYVTQTLTDAQKQQARANIGATAPEIFWATYGATTATEIGQAVADGKLVVCYANYSASSGHLFVLTQINITLYWEFGSTEQSVSYYLRCNKTTNVWSQQRIFLEQSAKKSNDIPTDRESTTKYPSVKAVADALGKWGVISQTQTWTGNNNTGYDYTMSNQVYGLIPQTSIDLFEDVGAIFNDTGVDIVRQDPFGYDVTHKAGCFYLSGMGDISYKEMITIYECRWSVPQIPIGSVPATRVFEATRARYGLVTYGHNWSTGFNLYMIAPYNVGSPLSVLCLSQRDEVYIGSARQMLLSVPMIKAIYPVLNLTNLTGTGSSHNTFYGAFGTCSSLKDVRFKSLKIDVPFGQCPSISLASVVYMVDNAANTTAITITLHATAYARCVADTTEYTYNGQTYTGIIAYAAAKNITIASA